MSNVHVLEQTNGVFRLVYHIAIPAANNPAGFSYRTAVINSKLGGTTILPDGDGTAGTISATEKANIVSGAVVERIRLLDVTQGGGLTTAAQINAFIDQDYAAASADLLTEAQARLAQFGRVR